MIFKPIGVCGVIALALLVAGCEPIVVTINSPSQSSFVKSRCVTATFSATGGSGILRYACSMDGAPAQSCASGQTLCVASDGPHALEVTASDASGQKGSTRADFVVDTIAPVLSPGNGGPYWPGNDTCWNSAQQWSTFYTFERVTTECKFDTLPYGSCNWPAHQLPYGSAHADGTYQFTTYNLQPLLPNGVHTFSLKATDLAGNVSEVTQTFRVHAPVISVTAPASGSTLTQRSVVLAFSAALTASEDPECYFDNDLDAFNYPYVCQLDGGAAFECTPGITLGELANGTHTLGIKRRFSNTNGGMMAIASSTFTVAP
ncbi:MAG TPA: hypothetical protein VI072_20910 [Polyangiaceae bacterium]